MIFPGPRLPGLWCRNGECGRFLEWHWSIASGIQVADLRYFCFFIIVTLSKSSQEQQRLREKQKMLKNDWERFKQQRKEIESSLMEKPQAGGGGWVPICHNLPNLTSYHQRGPCHPWGVPAPASHWAGGGDFSPKSNFLKGLLLLKFCIRWVSMPCLPPWSMRCDGELENPINPLPHSASIVFGFISHLYLFVGSNVSEKRLKHWIPSHGTIVLVCHSSFPSWPIVITHCKGYVPLPVAAGDSRWRSGRRWSRISRILASVSIWNSIVRPLAQRGGISSSLDSSKSSWDPVEITLLSPFFPWGGLFVSAATSDRGHCWQHHGVRHWPRRLSWYGDGGRGRDVSQTEFPICVLSLTTKKIDLFGDVRFAGRHPFAVCRVAGNSSLECFLAAA